MIELPECYVLAQQIGQTLTGRTITQVVANASPHAFAFFGGDPAEYAGLLTGKQVTGANPGTGYTCGGNTEILCGDMLLVISTPIRYHKLGAKLPPKHQLMLGFDDGSHLTCTVQMWGAMLCYPLEGGQPPAQYKVNRAPTPLQAAFDQAYFNRLWQAAKPNLSAKAFLATEQRIPGLGNGVLQDILFNARIHPKRKLSDIHAPEQEALFHSVKSTLWAMRDQGGRDTEKDFFGQSGGYQTILSKKTVDKPCRVCGADLQREAYLGGNITFCPTCQP